MDAKELKRMARERFFRETTEEVADLIVLRTVQANEPFDYDFAESVKALSHDDRVKMAGLTPDQWLVIISLIGDIVLKIIERRNSRPKD